MATPTLRRDPQADRWHLDYLADLPDGRTLYVRGIGAGLYSGSTSRHEHWSTALYIADTPARVLDWFLAWRQGEES
jgi:hypothetical protein